MLESEQEHSLLGVVVVDCRRRNRSGSLGPSPSRV